MEGGSADVAGRWEGGGLESGWVLVGSWRAPKIMGARRAPKIMGARRAPKIMGARRAPKIMGARPHSESTQNNGGVPSFCGRFGDSSSSSLQLRVDVSKIRSR